MKCQCRSKDKIKHPICKKKKKYGAEFDPYSEVAMPSHMRKEKKIQTRWAMASIWPYLLHWLCWVLGSRCCSFSEGKEEGSSSHCMSCCHPLWRAVWQAGWQASAQQQSSVESPGWRRFYSSQAPKSTQWCQLPAVISEVFPPWQPAGKHWTG